MKPTPLLAKSGERLQWAGVGLKSHWINRMLNTCGSGEVVIRQMMSRHGGAADVRNARLRLHERERRSFFAGCKYLHLNWDGGSYGGLSVNIALATRVETGIVVHMKPAVHMQTREIQFRECHPKQTPILLRRKSVHPIRAQVFFETSSVPYMFGPEAF